MVYRIIKPLVRLLRKRTLDDDVDLIVSFWTPIIHLFLATTILLPEPFIGKQYVCSIPQHSAHSWTTYSKAQCYLQKSVFFSHTKNVDHITNEQKNMPSDHYVWCFWMFLVTSVISILPKAFWYWTQEDTVLKMSYFIKIAEESRNDMTAEEEQNMVDFTSMHLEMKLISQKLMMSLPKFIPRASTIFFVTKVMYITVMIGQFLVIPHFLGLGSDYLWSIYTCWELYQGLDWLKHSIFPVFIYCKLSSLATEPMTHDLIFRCANNLNLMLIRAFVFLSFWFPFAAIIVAAKTVHASRSILTSRLIRSFLEGYHVDLKRDVEEFSQNYLGTDGKLVIYMMSQKNTAFTKQVVKKVFLDYLRSKIVETDSYDDTDSDDSTDSHWYFID